MQVELTIGRKTMRSKAVKGDVSSGEFNFYQALEMEDDYAYDDEVSVGIGVWGLGLRGVREVEYACDDQIPCGVKLVV